jgi:hypothetical protein
MRKSSEENEMTDEELQPAEEYIEKYTAEYKVAIKEGKRTCKMSFWEGFASGRNLARVLIAERLLVTGSNLSLDELAAATFLNTEAVLALQTRMMKDESKRLENKQQMNEKIAKNKKFTLAVIEKQAAIIVELQNDLIFLFQRTDKLNEIQSSISALMDAAKNAAWCENDIKERNRIYSELLQNMVASIGEFSDEYTDEHTDKYMKIVQKYVQIIHKKKSQSDKDDADDNEIFRD